MSFFAPAPVVLRTAAGETRFDLPDPPHVHQPLVQATDPAIAVKTAEALAAGGLQVVEVVFRTDEALECLQAVADQVPNVIAGAGTVLTAAQTQAALDNGAKFIVSPGLDDGVVKFGSRHGRKLVDILPE